MGDDVRERVELESQLRVLQATVSVEVVRARNLPRGGILAPKAQVRVYSPFLERPIASTEPAASRTTAPHWNYSTSLKLRHHASTLPLLKFVVADSLDTTHHSAPLGVAHLTLRAPATRAWLPLDAENSRGDLLVVVRWLSCPINYVPHFPDADHTNNSNNNIDRYDTKNSTSIIAPAGPELRTVDPRPGAIFRRASFVVEVSAAGIPASVAQPWLSVRTSDQRLRGGETLYSRAWWRRKCERTQHQSSADSKNSVDHHPPPPAATTPSASCDSVTDTSLDANDQEEEEDDINVNNNNNAKIDPTTTTTTPATAALDIAISKVNLDPTNTNNVNSAIQRAIDPNDSSRHYIPIIPVRDDDSNNNKESKRSILKQRVKDVKKMDHGALKKGVKSAKEKASSSLDMVTNNVRAPTRSGIGAALTSAKVRRKSVKKVRDKVLLSGGEGGAKSASVSVQAAPTTTTTTASVLQALMAPRPRRAVDFGTFTFAELAIEAPKSLHLTITDNDSHLSDVFGAVLEAELPLDILGTHADVVIPSSVVLAYCEAGPVRAKASIWVRVTRIPTPAHLIPPPAPVNLVTDKFMALLGESPRLAAEFKTRYPHAEGLTYLFVGGLFTNHYPLYFTRNVDYLQQTLCLPRVQCIPIHTESGLAANAKVIAASVAKTATRRNSVVLIGHSKGGCDILHAITHHIEIIPFIHGVISFQAPFLGTYAIDVLKRSMLADAIGSAIETLWHGQRSSLLDMSYSTRKAALHMFFTTAEGKEGISSICVEGTNAIALREIPIVSVASHASFALQNLRSAATAAGIASMSPIAAEITKNTGFCNDGLVVPADALIPYSDAIYLGDMMHTEPSLYVPGTKYPPGELTAAVLALLFDKAARGVHDTGDASK